MATEYLTTDIDLKKVADGIRSRTGKTTPLAFPDGYVTEIGTLTNTSDATAAASDIASGKTAYVKGEKVTGELPEYFQIYVGSVDQRAIPYSTSDGFMVEELCSISGNTIINDNTKAITYIAIPGDATPDSVLEGATFSSSEGIEVTGTMPDNGAAAIQLSNLGIVDVAEGYYSGGTAKVADAEAAKIIPENIKKGVTILGVPGSMSGTELSIVVTVTSGAVVTATKGATEVSGTSVNGICTLALPEAGTWSVKATLGGQTSDTKSVSVVDSYAVTLTFFSATITVNVDSGASVTLKKGGTTIATKTSNGTAVFTVTETGEYTVTATKNGQTTSGSVNVVSGTTSYALTLIFLKDNFADNDWAFIIAACHSGSVPSTWVVGNSKTMTINGASYQVDIIGKNHDTYASGGKAPLTFQLHDCYADTKAMNSTDTNSGGWKNSAMRTTHLPAILALMPTEVQNGIREVSKKASVGGASLTIETVSDKLFLLSEVEIFGSNHYSVAGEGTQYDYYKAGNSKAKKRNGSRSAWWERSPRASNSARFCLVSGVGNVFDTNASGASGVAFGFCF